MRHVLHQKAQITCEVYVCKSTSPLLEIEVECLPGWRTANAAEDSGFFEASSLGWGTADEIPV
jgi:hypothetical protein